MRAMNAQTRLLPQQTRLASFEPATFNAEARTVEVVWTTGVKVARYNYWDDERYEEELEISEKAIDLGRMNSGAAPVLDSHRTYGLDSQIGVVERAWIKGKEGRAVIRLSGREDLAGIVRDIADGIIRNISVGYAVRKYEITREVGKTPIYRAVDWEPRELSFVTVPADAVAGTRAADSSQGLPCVFTRADAAPTGATNMPDNTHEGASAAENAARQAEKDKAAEAARIAAEEAKRAADADAAKRAAAIAESATRAADIIDLSNKHGCSDKAAEWIRAGKSLDEVRALVLELRAASDANSPGSFNRVQPGLDEADKHRAAGVDVLLARSSVIDVSTKKPVVLDRSNPYRGYTLFEMARSSLERLGVRTSGMSKMEVVGRAFTQTASDFPVLLENAMHKALQSAYALAPDTWSRFCAIGTVSDFRAHSRYRTGSIGDLDDLTAAGEFKNKTIPDGEKGSITAATKGNIINLTRHAIINDDLGAFMGLAMNLGRAGRRSIENAVYALLASNPNVGGVALFHADHGNLGTAGVVSVASVEEGRNLMAKQKDAAGVDYLDLRPSIWLGSTGYGGTARVVNGAEYDPDTVNKLQRPNMVRGLFRDVVDSPRIANNYWYMFADPADAPVIEVAFLDDQREPYLESEEGFEVDGTRWKVRLDFGVAAIDYRGAVRNNGA